MAAAVMIMAVAPAFVVVLLQLNRAPATPASARTGDGGRGSEGEAERANVLRLSPAEAASPPDVLRRVRVGFGLNEFE